MIFFRLIKKFYNLKSKKNLFVCWSNEYSLILAVDFEKQSEILFIIIFFFFKVCIKAQESSQVC